MFILAIPLAVGAINIMMQNTNSSVSLGVSLMSGWSAHRKTNNGVGNQAGLYSNIANMTIIIDNDLNDGQIIDPDVYTGVQGQAL